MSARIGIAGVPKNGLLDAGSHVRLTPYERTLSEATGSSESCQKQTHCALLGLLRFVLEKGILQTRVGRGRMRLASAATETVPLARSIEQTAQRTQAGHR
jgi:hypothetical protein